MLHIESTIWENLKKLKEIPFSARVFERILIYFQLKKHVVYTNEMDWWIKIRLIAIL